MIGWLEGQLGHAWQENNRSGILLICAGVGYEVQISKDHWADMRLSPAGTLLRFWIHHLHKEDGSSLFGFNQQHERDIFRLLISVSGVGPQVAMALMGAMPAAVLVEALQQGNLALLSSAQGVGKRTAERLSLELRQKLERFELPLANPIKQKLPIKLETELEEMLCALGYGVLEIHEALKTVGPLLSKEEASSSDAWLRESLRWLGRLAN
jgi:Holliday junction DNA helicase RuvA